MKPADPISAEARGAVRVFKAMLAREARAFETAFRSRVIERNAERYARCGPVGRSRAMSKMRSILGRLEHYDNPWLVWAYLYPRDAVIVKPGDPGQAQDAVVVNYAAIGRNHFHVGLWTLEVPDHALRRLAQRARGVNLRAAVLQAHRELLGAGLDHAPNGDLLVRAGPGAFVGQVIYAADESAHGALMAYYRPRTWLHEDMLTEGQEAIGPADGGRPLGNWLLLPMPMRTIEMRGSKLEVRPFNDNV